LELRKIQRAGGERECLQVTIPKKYCDNLRINVGDYVEVTLDNSCVRISPLNFKEEVTNEHSL